MPSRSRQLRIVTSKLAFAFVAGLLLTPALWGAKPTRTAQHLPLPLVFEPNRGQAAPSTSFLARNGRYSVRLSPELVEILPSGGAAPLRIRLEGASRHPALEGVDPLPGHTSYYLGADPRLWRTGIPNFAQVRYRAIYPGVDMLFYGNAGQLEYDLVVSPHADAAAVRLRFEGARRLSLDAHGDLRIETASGVLWQKLPTVYQGDPSGRRAVPGRYLVEGNRVRFSLGDYDPSATLTIDPVLVYATYFGGKSDDSPSAIAVDAAGNAYIAGYTVSTGYPASPKSSTNTTQGGEDVFVTKLDPTGQKVLYSVILGGTMDEEAYAIAVDSSGSAYVVGTTDSTNFPVLNPNQGTSKGAWDAFVLKLDASGTLAYSTYLGGGQMQPCACDPDDFAYAVAVDPSGTAYVTGETWSADFPTTIAASSRVPDHGDAFVTGFNSSGKLVFSTLLGGSLWDVGYAIAIGASGSVYVGGSTLSTDLAVTAGALQTRNAGSGSQGTGDAWVAKLNPKATAGGALVLAMTYLGGSSDEDLFNIRLDSAENVYLSGSTLSSNFPVTQAAYQTKYAGGSTEGDGFVVKLNSSLTAAIYSTYFGGAGDEFAAGLQVDSAGDAYITGWTDSANLTPLSLGTNSTAVQSAFSVGYDGYLAELNPSGSAVLYFTYLGQGGISWGADMGMDGAGNLYPLFATRSEGLPVTSPALQSTLAGGQDIFLMKLTLPAASSSGVTISSINVAGGGSDIAQNAWIEIHGGGLAPASAASGVTWNGASDLASGRMPTQLQGVSVSVDLKPAYVYYVSPTQINVLTPLDNTVATVPVTVTNNGGTSAPFTVNLKAVAPAFLLWSGRYIEAEHADYSYSAPVSFGAGFTPAQPGETIALFGTGFGLPTGDLVEGLLTQSSPLPNLPVILIGGAPATVSSAWLISPGLYQFNVTVPLSTPDGDVAVAATYAGATTPAGAYIAVQH